MHRVTKITMIIALTMCLTFSAAYANNDDDLALLQDVLRDRYPQVASWEFKASKAMHTKRKLKLFAQPVTDVNIFRDGALFVVQSERVSHYLVKAEKPMVTMRVFVKRGETLKAEDTSVEPRDSFALSCDLLKKNAMQGNLRVKHDLRPGDAICEHDVETTPLITKHDPLVMHCDKGEVHISVTAKALEEGDMGSVIKVRRDSVHPIVSAIVTGKGEVNACI